MAADCHTDVRITADYQGLARLGRLIEFIPLPVTLGFTSGIAITISTMQIKDFFGLHTASLPEHYLGKVAGLLSALPMFTVADTLVGIVTLGVLIYWPLLGAIESLLCTVVLDSMTGKKHQSDNELIGQGIGNVLAPFFGGITATAAIARSAANVRAGSTSPVSALVHALLVLLALLVLAPALSWLPLSTMAALLLLVAWNMSEAHKVIYLLRRAPKDDIIVMLLCMSLTVLFDMVIAITVGIVLASLLFMRRMTRLTELPCDLPATRMVSVNDPLFFAAAERIFAELSALTPEDKYLILQWDTVPVLDAGGLQAFMQFCDRLPAGQHVLVTDIPFQPLKTLARANVLPIPGRLSFCSTLPQALTHLPAPVVLHY